MRSLWLCGGFVALVAGVGCSKEASSPYSSSANPVTGKVVAVGGALQGGAEIVLTPKAKEHGIFGKEASSPVALDGSFALKTIDGAEGVPGGFYTVVVRPYGTNASAKQAAARAIPKKYWDESTSDLTVEIDGAKQGWEVKLGH